MLEEMLLEEERSPLRGLVNRIPEEIPVYIPSRPELQELVEMVVRKVDEIHSSYSLREIEEKIKNEAGERGIRGECYDIIIRDVLEDYLRFKRCLRNVEPSEYFIVANLPLASVSDDTKRLVFYHLAKLNVEPDIGTLSHEAIHLTRPRLDLSFCRYLIERFANKSPSDKDPIYVRRLGTPKGERSELVLRLPSTEEGENSERAYFLPAGDGTSATIRVVVIGGDYTPNEVLTELLNTVLLKRSGLYAGVEGRKRLLYAEQELIRKVVNPEEERCVRRMKEINAYLLGMSLAKEPLCRRIANEFIDEYVLSRGQEYQK